MRRKIKVGVGVVALGISAGAGLWVWTACRSVALHWQQGARQSYAFHSQTLFQGSGAGNGAGPLRHASFAIDGMLNLRVVDAQAESVQAAVQWSAVEVRQNGARDKEVEQLYAQLFYVTFARDGQMLAFDFPNTSAREDQRAVADALRALQVIVPQKAGRSWTTTESDQLGTYDASYDASGPVTKTKRGYREVFDTERRIDVHGAVELEALDLAEDRLDFTRRVRQPAGAARGQHELFLLELEHEKLQEPTLPPQDVGDLAELLLHALSPAKFAQAPIGGHDGLCRAGE